jgi:hypothetical protein
MSRPLRVIASLKVAVYGAESSPLEVSLNKRWMSGSAGGSVQPQVGPAQVGARPRHVAAAVEAAPALQRSQRF